MAFNYEVRVKFAMIGEHTILLKAKSYEHLKEVLRSLGIKDEEVLEIVEIL